MKTQSFIKKWSKNLILIKYFYRLELEFIKQAEHRDDSSNNTIEIGVRA